MPELASRLQEHAKLQTKIMSTSTTISVTAAREWSIARRWPAFVALAFGMILLYFVGFSPIARAHNSAHDTRHANGFPCH
jgi:cobalt transporter subunit CbtB